MKSQKALIAITRKILVIIYNVLNTKQPFDPARNLHVDEAPCALQANEVTKGDDCHNDIKNDNNSPPAEKRKTAGGRKNIKPVDQAQSFFQTNQVTKVTDCHEKKKNGDHDRCAEKKKVGRPKKKLQADKA
jgi:hypothetical protein